MENLLQILLYLFAYGGSLLLVYILYKKYGKVAGEYINEMFEQWPELPTFANWIIGIFFVMSCAVVQTTFLFHSLIVFLMLLFLPPLLQFLGINRKFSNIVSLSSFFISGTFMLMLFFSIDSVRDIIGERFISGYDVYYTTEYVSRDYGNDEVEVANINTGNVWMDFFWESIFPTLHRIFVGGIYLASLLFAVKLREQAYPEIKKVLERLSEIGENFNQHSFEVVRKEVDALIQRDKKGSSEYFRNNPNLDSWILGTLSNISGDLVESGQFHLYRGILNPMGPGEGLLEIFDYCVDQLADQDVISSEKAEEQKKAIRKNLATVG